MRFDVFLSNFVILRSISIKSFKDPSSKSKISVLPQHMGRTRDYMKISQNDRIGKFIKLFLLLGEKVMMRG
ncbi:MAG TPA: hypothetical protein DCS44_06260 [Cyanobacteria bacterium UBA10660]|nr:MAG TPA: hypothetical protein CPT83_01015 [Candidatus Gastranaerophilales bacterium HUM_1]HAS94200.1 hypothetical protein [Cyanobacteria bacterium UBA10660]